MTAADLCGAATQVAVTVTVVGALTEAGAVYTPEAEIAPVPGWIDHRTVPSVAPETTVENARLWPADTTPFEGLT